uniref:Uncharacterized protein n=1 Tax=Glossina austeni TaxID=7395 RepID=A0A1A9UE81_GLOAU
MNVCLYQSTCDHRESSAVNWRTDERTNEYLRLFKNLFALGGFYCQLLIAKQSFPGTISFILSDDCNLFLQCLLIHHNSHDMCICMFAMFTLCALKYHPPVEDLKIDEARDWATRHVSYRDIAFLQLELKFSLPSAPNRLCYPLLTIAFQLLLPKLILDLEKLINLAGIGIVKEKLRFSLTNAQMLRGDKKNEEEMLRHKNREES